MDWASWLKETTQGASARKLAPQLNRSHTAVAGWMRGKPVPAEVVIEIARLYHADPVAGLIAAGYLSIEEMVPHMRSIIRNVPVSFLTDELHERALAWELAAQTGVPFRPTFPVPKAG